jgi:hypothetical protein
MQQTITDLLNTIWQNLTPVTTEKLKTNIENY